MEEADLKEFLIHWRSGRKSLRGHPWKSASDETTVGVTRGAETAAALCAKGKAVDAVETAERGANRSWRRTEHE